MAISSRDKGKIRYRSTHIFYAVTYVIVTIAVLMFLNIYTSQITQELFYKSKKASMIEKCQLAASGISNLEILNESGAGEVIEQLSSLTYTRLIITDQDALVIYDSENLLVGKYALFPEISDAMNRHDVFTWHYNYGGMESTAATPIYAYGSLIGSVYITEYDTEQGLVIYSLQKNILIITLILEIFVILFSISFSAVFTRKLKKIMASIHIIREGNYDHKVKLGGRDELTVLGNEFNTLTERLYTSENKRRQFVSDASHELKTPLASIKLLTDSILQNPMDKETILEFVEDIGNEADRLNRMSHKLLSLSKIESENEFDKEIIYIKPVLDKVIRMLTPLATDSQVSIRQSISQDSTILVVPDDLYQILFNLVENGIKYNTFGGELYIELSAKDENAIIIIKDTGVGIPEDALSHIFERFYRVDKARSRKSGGSGLGLSIVHNMVKRNSGDIFVSSQVGDGSQFTVIFPIFSVEETE